MKNKFSVTLAFVVIAISIFISGCGKSVQPLPGGTGATPESANNVIDANNKFALDLYSEYKSEEGNVFFSPYSISTALAMTYEGAKGKTAEEMRKVFHFPEDDTLRRSGFAKVYNEINKEDKEYKLNTANALWAQKDYQFLDEYFNLVGNYYGGKVTNLDFVSDPEGSRITINNWVEDQTNDKIKDLIPAGIINAMTRLVLTNAIYFKGTWLKQFEKKYTQERDFKVTPSDTVKAMMMSLTGKEAEFNYAETEKLQVLELPYSGKELSMLILLPKENDLKIVEDSLTAEKLAEIRKSLIKERVDVYIPRFKFETKYFMADTLQEMGMPTAFSLDADFSGMTGKKDLYIGHVIHQAFVEVNEEGTEAAAATAVIMQETSAGPMDQKIFNADHPFIFLIQESGTGNILFIGRVVNPSE